MAALCCSLEGWAHACPRHGVRGLARFDREQPPHARTPEAVLALRRRLPAPPPLREWEGDHGWLCGTTQRKPSQTYCCVAVWYSTVIAPPGRIGWWFEGKGVSTSRVSPPGPLSIYLRRASARGCCATYLAHRKVPVQASPVDHAATVEADVGEVVRVDHRALHPCATPHPPQSAVALQHTQGCTLGWLIAVRVGFVKTYRAAEACTLRRLGARRTDLLGRRRRP